MDETLILILAFVGIVFSFLSLILFFKVWGMTNNVKNILILNKKNNKDSYSKAQLSYAQGDIDSAEKFLNQAFIDDVIYLLQGATSAADFNSSYYFFRVKYQAAFKKIGRPAPDFNKYADFNKYKL